MASEDYSHGGRLVAPLSLGLLSPLGWLCMTINALAAVIIATRKTSRGWTKIVSIVPIETM